MRTSLKRLSIFMIVMMFFAVMSAGCGSSGGGNKENVSQDNGNSNNGNNISGWDTDLDEQNQNNNGNNNQDDNNNNNGNSDNQNDNNNDNNNDNGNDNQNNNNGSPVAINGTWEIVSGSGVSSSTLGQKEGISHYTYIPGRIGAIGVEVSRNTWGGTFEGAYCVTLTGKDLAQESTIKGTGEMHLYCTVDEYPDREAMPLMVFTGGMTFDYIGDGTYQDTNETYAKYTGVIYRIADYKSTLMLENSSTLRWRYWTKANEAQLGISGETSYEIVLKKVQ